MNYSINNESVNHSGKSESSFKRLIKNFIKDRFLIAFIRDRFSASVTNFPKAIISILSSA